MTKQTWENLAGEIEAAVDKAYEAFKTLPESAVSIKPGPEKWSAKEILGHLIDSAANNHFRQVDDAFGGRLFLGGDTLHTDDFESICPAEIVVCIVAGDQ